MSRLSLTSTWAVAFVIVSGFLKSYRALGGQVGALRSGIWGSVLIVKAICVAGALSLGALNRFWLKQARAAGHVEDGTLARSVAALRVEAALMVLILALSALLGNVEPPEIS